MSVPSLFSRRLVALRSSPLSMAISRYSCMSFQRMKTPQSTTLTHDCHVSRCLNSEPMPSIPLLHLSVGKFSQLWSSNILKPALEADVRCLYTQMSNKPLMACIWSDCRTNTGAIHIMDITAFAPSPACALVFHIQEDLTSDNLSSTAITQPGH
ncbi:hypothetical protein ABKN59_003676 [Abortiporus biennis]